MRADNENTVSIRRTFHLPTSITVGIPTVFRIPGDDRKGEKWRRGRDGCDFTPLHRPKHSEVRIQHSELVSNNFRLLVMLSST